MVRKWVRDGLAKSTLSRYEKGWTRWIEHIAVDGHGENLYLDGVDREESIKVVVLFIRSLCLGFPGNKSTVDKSMAAVHSSFTQASKCGLLFTCDTVKLARKSSGKKTNAMRLYGKRNEKKLPVAHEMMLYLREKYWVNTDWISQVDQKLTWIGIAVAMDCLLRISEFALVPDSDHMLRSSDVAFELQDVSVICQPGELRSAISRYGKQVRRVQIHIPYHRSKVVKSERKLFLNWRGPDSAYGTQVLNDFTEYCIREGSSGDVPLFSRVRKGRRKLLTYGMVTGAVKEAAGALGLLPVDFATHSIRIGGATSMCAAGWDRAKIQQRGGWSDLSNSDLIYALSLPSDSLTPGTDRHVTVDDVRWLQVFHNRTN